MLIENSSKPLVAEATVPALLVAEVAPKPPQRRRAQCLRQLRHELHLPLAFIFLKLKKTKINDVDAYAYMFSDKA